MSDRFFAADGRRSAADERFVAVGEPFVGFCLGFCGGFLDLAESLADFAASFFDRTGRLLGFAERPLGFAERFFIVNLLWAPPCHEQPSLGATALSARWPGARALRCYYPADAGGQGRRGISAIALGVNDLDGAIQVAGGYVVRDRGLPAPPGEDHGLGYNAAHVSLTPGVLEGGPACE